MIADILNGKAAYYHAPKCGSRTILGWIAILESPEIYTKYPIWFRKSSPGKPIYHEIRNRIKIVSKKFVVTCNHPVRFCIIRNPVDRFLSGYTNRIIFHRDLNQLNIEPPSVSDFIKNFDYYNKVSHSTKIHFQPQEYFYGKDLNLYTHIFNFKQFGDVKKLLETVGNATLPDLHLQQSGDLQKPVLTEAETEWVKNLYKVDYELYGKYIN